MGEITRRQFLAASAGTAASLALLGRSAFADDKAKRRRPNIIIMYTDDMPYNALSFTGGKDAPPTPHIDSLGKEGVFFKCGYIPQAWCGPSRAGILTGRHPRRFGFTRNYSPFPRQGPKREKTIADIMTAAGYRSIMVGKYGNLGGNAPEDSRATPLQHGWQDCYWFGSGGHKNVASPDKPHEGIYRNKKLQEGVTDFLPLVWGREAAAYVDKHKDHPFLMYVAFNQPHGPVEATEAYLNRFAHIKDENKRHMFGLMAGLDDAVGMILAAVKRNGLDEDTLIFFSNDNGKGQCGISNAPYRGGKHSYTEGGVRVPTFCRWSGHIKPGAVSRHPMTVLDLVPTAAALAGAKLPEKPLDGIDLAPFIIGKNQKPTDRVLFWFQQNRRSSEKANTMRALRYGDWKILRHDEEIRTDDGKKEHVDRWYLVHLPTNPSEEIRPKKGYSTNEDYPELLAAMKQMLLTAEKQVLADKPLKLDRPKLPPGPKAQA